MKRKNKESKIGLGVDFMDHLNRYENKSIFYTRLSLVGNICWVSLKLILGFLVSYVFLASALFQIFIVISKAYLYFNIKKEIMPR